MTYSRYRARDFDKIVDLASMRQAIDCPLLQPGVISWDFVPNSRGFLGPELSYEKKANEYRIVFLGDSFVAGTIPYKYSFIRLVQEKLNREKPNSDKRYFQTINLGIPCTGPAMYVKELEIEGQKYNPDLIVVGFFVGNDFTDDYFTLMKLRERETTNNNFALQILSESRLLSLVNNLTKVGPYLNGNTLSLKKKDKNILGVWKKNTDTGYDPFTSTFTKSKYLQIQAGRIPILYTDSDAYDDLDFIEKSLLAIKKIAVENKSQLLVMVIPDELQVNNQLLAEVAELEKKDVSTFKMTQPQEKIAD